MIVSNIVRTAATVACLLGLCRISSAGAISDLTCIARAGNASVSYRACAVEPTFDAGRGPGICIGRTARLRSRAPSFTALAMMKPARQNLCLKANSSAPLSHFALQAEP
jgi:hypothetical protein